MGGEDVAERAMGALVSVMREMLFRRKLEMVLVGLNGGGKSTLLQVLADGRPISTNPTISLEMKQFNHKGTAIKCWDLGGQERFRAEWPRYTRGVDVILFVVDAADPDRISNARHELHQLLENEELSKTPVLVVSNKIDLDPHVTKSEMVSNLNLDYITDNPWEIVEVSALRCANLDGVFSWLLKQKKKQGGRMGRKKYKPRPRVKVI